MGVSIMFVLGVSKAGMVGNILWWYFCFDRLRYREK